MRDAVSERPVLRQDFDEVDEDILAPHAGTVTALPVSPGQQVDAGTVLAVIDAVIEAVTEAEPEG